MSPKRQIAELRRTRVLELLDKGLIQATIAQRLGVTRSCVAAIVAREKAKAQHDDA